MDLQRVATVLTRPDEVFQDLADEAPNLFFAFGILAAHALMSNVMAGLLILYSDSPQVAQSRAALEGLGIPSSRILVVLAVLAPLGALLNWAITWVVVRLGSGTSNRLWETAAWSQAPNLVMVPLVTLLGTGSLVAATTGSVVSILWCARLVQSGVRELSGGNGTRAATVYAVVWIGYAAAAFALTQGASSPGGGGMIG